ncbi:hypothetical protein [Streptomyces sp. t39]|uniref:hypothetical protein n=1 Tax=Streptomyces sp. t39 TaxID=1828156 RepID=UPI00165078ED|nr:hypothetical protein [Streptomyces sp. t39]
MQHSGPADDSAASPTWQNLFLEPTFAPGTAEYDADTHAGDPGDGLPASEPPRGRTRVG